MDQTTVINTRQLDDTDPGPAQAGRRRQGRRSSPLTAIGLVLLIVGLAALGWAGYQYVGTNLQAEKAFQDGENQLRDDWNKPGADDKTTTGDDTPTGADIPGKAIALLRIPAFGPDYEVPILTGTDPDTLTRGVGHFQNTTQPGQIGNFALAGHRITHGQPFSRLLELKAGNKIIVETRDAIYTYTLDASPKELTVKDTETWVLAPTPGAQNQKPTKSMITLITCEDLFRSPDRSVGFGHLTNTQLKQ